jgi:hypothetical protein
VKLGVDQQHRLWLAWSEWQRQPFVNVYLAQIDPSTLTPMTSKSFGPVAHGGGGGSQESDDFTLLCTDTCRLVFSTSSGIFSWDSKAVLTKLLAVRRGAGGGLLAAADRGNRLEVVTAQGSTDYGWKLSVRAGDARGAHLRTLGTIAVPQAKPHPNETWNAYELRSAYTPAGFVGLAAYPLSGRTLQSIASSLLH